MGQQQQQQQQQQQDDQQELSMDSAGKRYNEQAGGSQPSPETLAVKGRSVPPKKAVADKAVLTEDKTENSSDTSSDCEVNGASLPVTFTEEPEEEEEEAPFWRLPTDEQDAGETQASARPGMEDESEQHGHSNDKVSPVASPAEAKGNRRKSTRQIPILSYLVKRYSWGKDRRRRAMSP